MREIKFRVWDKENNKYFVPTYEAYKGNLECLTLLPKGDLVMRTMEESIHESLFPDRFIVQLYTGLKDKNGTEIYERDKMTDGEYVGIVEFCEGKFVLNWENICEDLFECTDWEVIGNDNPELLEESK